MARGKNSEKRNRNKKNGGGGNIRKSEKQLGLKDVK